MECSMVCATQCELTCSCPTHHPLGPSCIPLGQACLGEPSGHLRTQEPAQRVSHSER